jgi:hypothetical protein
MDIELESSRWLAAGIIDRDQRRRIVALYPKDGGPSLAVLALLWTGGTLVFLGVAFFLGIVWRDLGGARALVVGALTAGFTAAGFGLRHAQPRLEKTAMALLVIAGLLVPSTLGIAWDDLFGSSGHPMPLVLVALGLYAAATWKLRSRAFAVLTCCALFVVGEEVIRDDDLFGPFFPLVQMGLVDRLAHIYPVVFLSIGAAVVGLSLLCGKHERTSHLRGTFFTCALLLGLLPALYGAIDGYQLRALKLVLAVGGSAGGMAAAVALRQRRAFWVAGASLVLALLIAFGKLIDDSLALVCFAIVAGIAVLGLGSWLALAKNTWIDRLFGDDRDDAEEAPPPAAGAA